jgi:hypothetical protein
MTDDGDTMAEHVVSVGGELRADGRDPQLNLPVRPRAGSGDRSTRKVYATDLVDRSPSTSKIW